MRSKNDIRKCKSKLLKTLFPQQVTGLYARAFAAESVLTADIGGRTEHFTPRSEAPIPENSNIVGIAYGLKESNGQLTDEEALKIYVKEKRPANWLEPTEAIPQFIETANGKVPTDIVVTGEVMAIPAASATAAAAVNPRLHSRPTKCGVSISHYLVTAGTLGCKVKRKGSNGAEAFILSNNHVLANVNTARLADLILQPGTLDGGNVSTSKDWIAKLSDFEVINLSGPGGSVANNLDAAIAQIMNPADVDPEILVIKRVKNPPVTAAKRMEVQKFGRTTHHTVGKIIDTAVDLWVNYPPFGRAWFEDQIAIRGNDGDFSSGGDSGSLIVTTSAKEPVALLFAGGTGITFANPIEDVLDRFDIEII